MYIISIEIENTAENDDSLEGLIITILNIPDSPPAKISLVIVGNQLVTPISIENLHDQLINYKYYGSKEKF